MKPDKQSAEGADLMKHVIPLMILVISLFLLLEMKPVFAQSEEIPEPVTRSYGTSIARDIIIQTDRETGSIIIIADEETNAYISRILANLDRPVPQVLIKVLFLEITHSKDRDLGVQGTVKFDGISDNDIIQTLFGLSTLATGGFYRILDDDLDITLRAMAQVGKLEVLSRPSVLARNNEEAVITVGQEVPFIRNTRVTESGQTINTVEYEDIGIILRVTPYIAPEGVVEMALNSEISTQTGETVPISDTIDAPVFAKRSAETRVVVPDRKTVVIGGLMEDNATSETRKVPFLGDIPLLGLAFRRKIDTNSKTELLIFLTPYVVRGGNELVEMTISEKEKAKLANEKLSGEDGYKYYDDPEDH